MNAVKIAAVDLKEADLTRADLSQSRLIAVDVTGADFSDVKTTDAQAAVAWSDAKVLPADLPEPIAMPPRWLPFLILGTLAIVAVLIMRRRKNRGD
jgi:hypothetical protein